ncbi:MAG: hypothetical protein L6V91_01630 [Bacilli bacterium]|nr:MAG: hypothetical protein L6V91_01630 [Bacilli bacterium]
MRKRNSQKIYKTTIVFIILDILAIACFIIMYGPLGQSKKYVCKIPL